MSSKEIDPGRLPAHVAIIMDGNGRWAKSRGKGRIAGHKAGVDSVREIAEASAELGIKYLTLYTFSTENWKRPRLEISALMELLLITIRKETETLNKNGIRLKTIGEISELPRGCHKALVECQKLTAHNSKMDLILALSYSGRQDITRAFHQIMADIRKGELKEEEVDEQLVKNYLYTKNIPDPGIVN